MTRCFFMIIFLAFNYLYAQKTLSFFVQDSSSGKPLPFVKIIILNNDKGVYSDISGLVNIKDIRKSDSLFIGHVGYYSKTLSCNDIAKKNRIFLIPKTYQLPEVIVKKSMIKNIEIGYLKKLTLNNNFWRGTKVGSELAVFIKNDFMENVFIKEIIFSVKKSEKNDPLLRIHLYKNVNTKPGKEIFLKNNILIIRKNKRVSLNIEKEYIRLPLNGIFVSIEWLGKYYLNDKLFNDTSIFLNPKLKAVDIKHPTAYVRGWKNEWDSIPLNAIPAIGLIIEKYGK